MKEKSPIISDKAFIFHIQKPKHRKAVSFLSLKKLPMVNFRKMIIATASVLFLRLCHLFVMQFV